MKYLTTTLATLAIALTATPALAGPYGDEMAKCLVKSTTVSDRNTLVKWMFAAAAVHPEVRDIAIATNAQRDELDRKVASMIENLLIVSCKAETRQASEYEGSSVFESSFRILGQVAGRELFADPAVSEKMGGFVKYIDEKKLVESIGPLEKQVK